MVEEDEFDKLKGSVETSFWPLYVPDTRIPTRLNYFHLATPFVIIQTFVDPILPQFFLAWQEGDCHGYRSHHIPF